MIFSLQQDLPHQPQGRAERQPVRRVRPADFRVDRRRARQGDA